ncbi:histone-fold-containing protein, partial [Aureobasidium melanogenum]
MPPKFAKKLTTAQTQRAIAKTQGYGSSRDEIRQAMAETPRVGQSQVNQPDQETQVDNGTQLDQDTQVYGNTQPDQETQVDEDTQPDADVPTSSADSDIVNDAMASTADGTDAATPNTLASSAHETETKPVIKKPAAKKVAGKKVPAADGKKDGEGTKRKRRRKQDPTNFQAYIHKVLRQVHPDCAITKTSMQIMNDFIKDLCLRIADLASDLCKKLKKATLQAHDIQTATKLVLSGGLAKHAQSEGAKALRAFNQATKQGLR